MTAAREVSPQWAARLAWALWLLAMLGLAATAWSTTCYARLAGPSWSS